MSVRRNITMDNHVHVRLRKQVPPKKLSAFISGAVWAKLYPNVKSLDAPYRAASKERWRTSLADDWKYLDEEGWIV